MKLRLSIEISLIYRLINYCNLLCIFCECHDTGAYLLTSTLLPHLLTSALLVLQKMKGTSFKKCRVNLPKKHCFSKGGSY